MRSEQYLDALTADAARLLEVAPRDLDAPVATCPGWLVSDVVEHLAVVYLHKIGCMRLMQQPTPWPPEPPHDDPVAWLTAALEELVDELRTRGPEAPSYTWYPPDQTVGFWYRRMAQETVVHRVDVELAVGERTQVDAELAIDGIDEVLLLMLDGHPELPTPSGPGRRVAIAPAGGPRWIVTLREDSTSVELGDEPVDAEITGEPEQLFLWSWGRADGSELTGPADVLAQLRERLALATQ